MHGQTWLCRSDREIAGHPRAARVLGVVLLLQLLPSPSYGLRLAPVSGSWALPETPRAGWVGEYHGCDPEGENCSVIGVGDSAQAGSPLVLDHAEFPIGTVEVRVCLESSLGDPEPLCGPLSEVGPLFIFSPSGEALLSARPPFQDEPVAVGPGEAVAVPLGILLMARPLEAELHVHVVTSSQGLRVELRAETAEGPVLFEGSCSSCPPDLVFNVSDAVNEAIDQACGLVVVVIEPVAGEIQIGGGNPASASHPAPYLRLGSLSPWLDDPESDPDGDGVPDDGDRSGVAGDQPCAGRKWMRCDDNCARDANPRQYDLDRDGIGDVCDACPWSTSETCRLALGSPLRLRNRAECYVEWLVDTTPLQLDKRGAPSSVVKCSDGDAGCDFDTVQDQCTFRLRLCLNQIDPRLPLCLPLGVETVKIHTARSGDDWKVQAQGLLAAAVEAAGLPNGQIGWCGEPFEIVVPLEGRAERRLPLRLRAVGTPEQGRSRGRADKDRILLHCLEN